MMISPESEPRWGVESRDALSKFLATREGTTFLEMLVWRRSRYTGDDSKRLVESGRVEGWEDCVTEIVELGRQAADVPAKHIEAYPAIDDEAAWAEVITSGKA